MHLYYLTPDGNTHYVTAEQARELLQCSRRTIDNYRRRPADLAAAEPFTNRPFFRRPAAITAHPRKSRPQPHQAPQD